MKITCPICQWTSSHPMDVLEGYCGRCHAWTSPSVDERLAEPHAATSNSNREQRLARIAHAESLGFKRCAPYASIGVKKPRWFWEGGYYDFDELPLLPHAANREEQR